MRSKRKGREEMNRLFLFRASNTKKMRLTHLSQTSVPPQQLQSTVESFKEEVRRLKELLQEKDQEIGRTGKQKEARSKACIDC